MNDGFGELPSLLDSLVFYPVWIGSQCVDMISGAVLGNPASVTPRASSPSGEAAANFSAASSQYLLGPSIPSYLDFSVAAWANPVDPTAANQWIFSDYYNTNNKRRWALGIGIDAVAGPKKASFVWSDVGTSPANVQNTASNVQAGWNLICGRFTANSFVTVDLNDYGPLSFSISKSVFAASETYIRIGAIQSVYFNGQIGPVAIWMRYISDREQQAYYANGQGINLSEFF